MGGTNETFFFSPELVGEKWEQGRMLLKRDAGAWPGCKGLSEGRQPQCSVDSSRPWELCLAGNDSETADTDRGEQQRRDPQHGIAKGGGVWPCDGGGHNFYFLGQTGCPDRKAHPPA